MAKDAIQKASTTSLAVPDYLKHEGSPVGMEEMTRADWTLPRLGLCQSGSPQRKRSDAKYIPGLEEGMMYNSITREIYGTSALVVPLMFFKSRFRFKEGELGSILCQSIDAKVGVGDPGGECAVCPMAAFGSSAKGNSPACSLFNNYPSLVLPKDDGKVGLDALVVASFKSSELKVSREWNTLLRLRNTDPFAGIYEFTTVEQKNDFGTWFTRVVKPAGWVSESLYNFAKGAYEAVRETQEVGSLKVDLDDAREPGEEA